MIDTIDTALLCSPGQMNTLKRKNRTSIIRSNEPVLLEIQGSYWPRLLLSESVETPIKNKTTSHKKLQVTKAPNRRVTTKTDRKTKIMMLRQLVKNSKRTPPPLPVLPSLDFSPLLVEPATTTTNSTPTWKPSTASTTPSSTTTITGMLWPHRVVEENKKSSESSRPRRRSSSSSSSLVEKPSPRPVTLA